jgi:1-acyl-sn-glycerol-3-phosphate acyltransferase
MLHFLPTPLLGLLGSALLALNTLFWCWPLFLASLIRLLLPLPWIQQGCDQMLRLIHEGWIGCNNCWIGLLGDTRWHLEGTKDFDYQHSYMVISNHQSWVDILALQYLLNRRVRPLKFFLKQELIWVPLIGLCWWALGFPFMKRYSKAYLARHPEKQGKDLETTRRACARFQGNPVAIFNFVEGTRFTESKHRQQNSPYRHLLKPRAGGVAFVLDAMGDQLHGIINVTLYYPQGKPGLWTLLSGQLQQVVVLFDALKIPSQFIGCDYAQDPAYRLAFQQWINELWRHKEQQLRRLHHVFGHHGRPHAP